MYRSSLYYPAVIALDCFCSFGMPRPRKAPKTRQLLIFAYVVINTFVTITRFVVLSDAFA